MTFGESPLSKCLLLFYPAIEALLPTGSTHEAKAAYRLELEPVDTLLNITWNGKKAS